jgi:hypothetical protein
MKITSSHAKYDTLRLDLHHIEKTVNTFTNGKYKNLVVSFINIAKCTAHTQETNDSSIQFLNYSLEILQKLLNMFFMKIQEMCDIWYIDGENHIKRRQPHLQG